MKIYSKRRNGDSAARGTLAEGRVLSQCAAKNAAHLSRQPARSLRRQPLSASSLVLESKSNASSNGINLNSFVQVCKFKLNSHGNFITIKSS